METESHPPRTLIGIEARTSNAAPKEIGEIWQRFVQDKLSAGIPARKDNHLIAVYCEYDGDHTQPYTFFLGCAVADDAEPPEGFSRRTIPAGNYVRYAASGEMPRAIMETWQQIWKADLNRSFVADFEIHDPASPHDVAIYVGVE